MVLVKNDLIKFSFLFLDAVKRRFGDNIVENEYMNPLRSWVTQATFRLKPKDSKKDAKEDAAKPPEEKDDGKPPEEKDDAKPPEEKDDAEPGPSNL